MSEFDDSPSIKDAVAAAAAKGEQPEAAQEVDQDFVDTVAPADAVVTTSTENAPPAEDHTVTSQTEG